VHVNKPKVVPFNPARLPQEYLSDAVENFAAAYPKHYLIPGRVFVTNEASAISTIVGSGVSVCLWDAQAGVGGANNFLLPEDSEKELNAKYGNHANRHLLHEMIAHGAEVARIQAKVFGGSEPPTTFSNSSESLGRRNVRSALQFLAAVGIRPVEQQTGGLNGRKVIFHTRDGSVSVETL